MVLVGFPRSMNKPLESLGPIILVMKSLIAEPPVTELLKVVLQNIHIQDDDGPIQLTPEQQKQLALIESMPLTMETEISQEEWAQKTPEEKERIMGTFLSELILVYFIFKKRFSFVVSIFLYLRKNQVK